jgi:hypothetical protein
MIDAKNSSSDGSIHSVDAAAHVVQERSYKKREIYTYNNGIYTLLKVHPPLSNYNTDDEDDEDEDEREDFRDQQYDTMKEFAVKEVEEEDEDDSIIGDIVIKPLPRGDKSCLLPTIVEEETILPANSYFKRSSSDDSRDDDDSRDKDNSRDNDHDCNDDVLATIHALLNWGNNLNENPTTTTSTSILVNDSKDVTPPSSSSSAVVPSMFVLSSSTTDNKVNSFSGKLVPTEHYKSSNDDDGDCSNKSNINTDETIQSLSSQPLKKKKEEEKTTTPPPSTVRDLLPRRDFGLYPPSTISFKKSYFSKIKTKMMGATTCTTTDSIACTSGCTGDDTTPTPTSKMKSLLCCNSNYTAKDGINVDVDIEKLSDSSTTSMVSLTRFPSSSKTTSSQDTNTTSSFCSDDDDDSDSGSSYLSTSATKARRQQQQQEIQSIIDDITTSSTVVDHDYYSFGSPTLASTIRLVEEYEEAFASFFCTS